MSLTVVVCEDSLLQRAQLVRLLQADGSIEVVGEAGAVDEAVEVVERLRPDVVTMDLEMPGGPPGTAGGLVAIERISERHTMPILVLSAYARERSDTLAIDALDAGAAEIFPKDLVWGPEGAADLRRLVGVLARLRVSPRRPAVSAVPARAAATGAIVGLVASTGGPTALRAVVGGLAGVSAPVLLVQHIHPEFVESFASWLEQTTGVPTEVGTHGARPQPGHVYVAPAGTHLRLGRDGELRLDPEPDVLSRPSGDELLRSLAAHAGRSVVAAVLTGMGDDGARGLLAVREAGGRTFAQDGGTAVVDGMPRAARELHAAERVLALDDLAAGIAQAVAGVRA